MINHFYFSLFSPEIAKLHKPKGVIVFGCVFHPWSEFFIGNKSPEQLVQIPEYKDSTVFELGYKKNSDDMWGRHWKFWQQLDSSILAKSWSEVKCPVLVLYDGTDYQQCSLVEPTLIEKQSTKSIQEIRNELRFPTSIIL